MQFYLLAPLLLIFAESAFAQSPTSFAILTAKSRLNLLSSDVCVNYQEFANGTIPEGPFRLAWWDSLAGNTAVCQPPRSARRFGPNEIVPIHYQSWPQILENQCQKYAFYTRNMNPIQYQANIATKAGAKALLFVVDRGTLNVNGSHDYLHSEFCQSETDEQGNGTVFFIYKDAFDQFILPKLRETADVELTFRKPEHNFDVAILLLWLLILLSVFLGSLWSARAARDRLARKGLVPVPQGIELRERGGAGTDSAGATTGKKSFLQTLCWAIAVIFGIIFLIIVYAKWHNTVTAVIWTALGILSISKCLFAICKYVIFPKRRGEQRVLLHFRKFQLTPLGLICYLIAAAICIPWFFIRKHPMAFLLLNLIDLAIAVFLIKYLTYEPLKKQQTLRDQLICSSVYLFLGIIFLTWFIIFPNKIKCEPIAPIDSDDEQMGSFFVPLMHDPLAICWDPKVELGYRHATATMLVVVLSAYFLPFWFLVDYINEYKFFPYGFVAFASYAIALLLYLCGRMFIPALNFFLIMPFPVWIGSIFALIKGTFMKLFKGNLQNLD